MSLPEVKSRIWTEEELREVCRRPKLAKTAGSAIPENHPGLILPEGGSLFLASTQPKKIHDAKKVFAAAKAKINVVDPIEVLHWFLSADEVSKTFTGNAYEKAESILNRVYDSLGYEKVMVRFKERGLNPDHAIFCVNDCGAYFDTDYSKEPEFSRSLHEKGRSPWPGVEFGPVTDAQGGLLRFFSDVRVMKQRREAAGLPVDLGGMDHQAYILFKLAPNRARINLFSFQGAVPVEFLTEPAPAHDDVLTSFHFSRATDVTLSPESRQKSRAELGDHYLACHSAEAHALRSFLTLARVPLSVKPLFSIHGSEVRKTSFSVATQHNVVSDPDFSPVEALPGLPFSCQVENATYNTLRNGAYQDLTRNADAVVLGHHSPGIVRNWDQHFLDMFDLWSSLIVDKQVRVETFENTPFMVLNRNRSFSYNDMSNGALDWDDPAVEAHFMQYLKEIDPGQDPWLQFILLTRYLHEKGFVKQEPRFLYTQVDPDRQDFNQVLETSLKETAGVKAFIPDYVPEEYGTDRTSLYEVTLLGSASTRVQTYTESAYNFGFWAASQGLHVRTGGGRYGIMGAGALGVLHFMEKNPNLANFCHFSAIQMPRTLQFEGACLDPVSVRGAENKYFLVAPSFDARMRSLFRSDAVVAMAPGMGTYQEINRFIRLKEAGLPELEDKKIIILNHEQPGTAGHIRLMDPYLAMVPRHIRREHMIILKDESQLRNVVLDVCFNKDYPSAAYVPPAQEMA